MHSLAILAATLLLGPLIAAAQPQDATLVEEVAPPAAGSEPGSVPETGADPDRAPVTREGVDDSRLAPGTDDGPQGSDPRLAPVTQEGPQQGAPAIGETAVAAGMLPESMQLRFSGSIMSELHHRLSKMETGQFYDRHVLPRQLTRNENSWNLRATAQIGNVAGVVDVDIEWLGLSEDLDDLGTLSRPERVSPPRMQTHALFLEATDLGFEGLDLRIGQQIVQWGVGDQFNPTNMLNPEDLENVLYFGRQIANLMATLDYAVGTWSVTAVGVPVFKPAVLPASAELGLTATDRLPFVSDELRWRLHSDNALGRKFGYPGRVATIRPLLPAPRLSNAQWALRVAGELSGHDIALSWYDGRTDIPVPAANHVRQVDAASCAPEDASDCIDGLLETDVLLRYPRVRVLGVNLAGELDPLGWLSRAIKPLGYRLEVGLYFPRERRFAITQEEVELLGVTRPAGEYDYDLPDGKRPLVIEPTPFAKWVLGFDYSFGRHVYANLMWVHGLPDEFGAGDFFHQGWAVRQGSTVRGRSFETDVFSCSLAAKSGEKCARELLRPRLGDYAVIGVDLKLLDERLLVRLFGILDVSGIVEEQWDEATSQRLRTKHAFWTREGHSIVLYPELQYNVGDGVNLAAGALLQMGKPYSKFGDPAAGGSIGWVRATYAY